MSKCRNHCAAFKAQVALVALKGAIRRSGPPETLNFDQGSQFTSFAWTGRL
jgi:putative transposase